MAGKPTWFPWATPRPNAASPTSPPAQMNSIGNKAYAGTASVAAVTGIPALADGKQFNIGIGYGNYLNQSAAAIGGHVRLNNSLVVKAAFGFANASTTTSVGLGFSF